MRRSSRTRFVAVTSAAFLAVALLDFFTGQELALSALYLIPVALTAWWSSRRAMIALSVASGLTAFLVDKLDGNAFSSLVIQALNGFTCFAVCAAIGCTICRLKRAIAERDNMNQGLRLALGKLHESCVEIRKLQSGLQTVCACTKRIKVGDEWMTPEEFLSSQLHMKLAHNLSVEIYQEIANELAQVA